MVEELSVISRGKGVAFGRAFFGEFENLSVQRPTSVTFWGTHLTDLYITSASVGLSQKEIQQGFNAGDLFRFSTHFSGMPTQAFLGSYIAMAIAFVGIAAATPVLAQQLPYKTRLFQMAQASPSIQGNWRLANMSEDAVPTPMLPSQELTADFSGDRLSGSGGCNRFMGGFKTQDNQLTIEPLASTFKACETSIMNQEAKYLAALQGAQRYEVNNQGLQIFYQTAQGSGILRFISQTVRALW